MLRSAPTANAHRSKAFGLTLLEVMIAMLLLATLFLSLTGLFTHLFASSTKGVDQTVAVQIAEGILENAASTSPDSWTHLDTQEKAILDPSSKTQFHTKFTWTPQLGAPNSMGDGYLLEAEVWWWSNDPNNSSSAHRDGYGKNSVLLRRFLYLQNVK